MKTVLVVSAWEPEIAPLRRRLRRGRAGDVRVVCRPVGVGAVDAAAGAARALAEMGLAGMGPTQLIFIGTAGRYPGIGAAAVRALPIGAVAVPGEMLLVSTAEVRGDGYLPAPLVQRAVATEALVAALRAAGATRQTLGTQTWQGVAATPLAITRTTALARRLASATGAAVENLEVFAVSRAAAMAGVPMAAALAIANTVGPTAHAEWRANHEAASRAACEVVWRWLRG